MVMHVELQATCSALGYQEGKTYVKEPDCLETVKDLIRFLRREDDSCDIRRQLGHAQILQNDLIPIIKQHSKDRQLFETIIRLVVNLTQPAVLCFKNQIPSDKTLRNYYLEIESHLQNYKEAFLDEELFSVLTERLGELLKLDWENRHEEDRLLIERLLILIRNVLHVPPNLDKEQRTDDDASVHDQVVWAMHCSGLEDLLLYVASSDEERQFSLHILEIISLMFREQTPEMLVSAGVQKSVAEKEKDERELEMVREQEKAQKLANIMKINARHSRFGGTYVVKNMKSISDKELIYHKTQQNAGNLTFDQTKKPKKKARNRQPIKDQPLFRRSTLSIRLSLKEFCIQFLENCYNPLMYAVKDSLNRQKAQDHDETYYLWSIRFFMEFCRLHSQQVELVSETMSVQAFHYIQVQLITYYEMQAMEKKEAVIWGKRIHLALKAYQELLMTLDMMGKSKNPQLYESAKVISGNIFYVMEFRDIFVSLLRKFDESRLSRSYLKDLVESTHLFLKMLEGACKKSSHLIVQTKKKKSTKKKKKQREVTKEHAEPSQQQLDDSWDEISGQLSAMMQGREEIPTDVAPFDAASEVEEEQQKADAMIRIQDCLRGKDPGTAIALFRAAREVWPERDIFGTQDISPEDEFMALREVFMASLPRPVAENTQYDEEEDGPDIGEEIEEEEMAPVESSEKEFDFKEYLHKFCKGEIIKCYVLLLADFNKNSTYTNHCIVKMLHRISVEMSYVGMMFQASLLRTFQKILLSPVSKLDRYKEILTFGKYIIRNFVQVAEQNPKVFVEILFWKTNKDASEIIHGYGSYQSKAKVLWTEDQEMELRRLYDEYSTVEDPERDVVDCIMQHITDRSKTRGQIIRELKNQGLIESAKDLKKPKRGARPGAWTEEETFDLANLMDMYRDSSDPIGNILANMQQKRSKAKVIEKLIELGLVNDRKELYKKRQRKSRKMNSWGDNEGDEDDDDDDDEHQQKEFQELPSDFEDPASSPNSSDKEMSDDSDSSDDDDGPDESSVASETSASMMDVIKNIIDKGYKDQVIWIQKSVERVAEEKKKQSNDVPVPIVPFTEENETAMEDEMFLNFLRKIGISPPANEQEAFWRIPGDMTVQELSTLSEGLTLDEDGVPINADKIKVHSASKQKEKKKDKKKENHKKQKEKDKQKKKKQKESSKKDKGGKNDPISKAKALKDLLKKRKLNKKRQSLEEKENMEERAPSLDDDEDKEKIPSPKRNRVQRMLSSDSDDDIPIMSRFKNKPSQSNDKTDPVHQSEEKRQEEEKEDSDREVMNSESQSSQSKRPLVFPDSSDEDDEENVQNPSKRLKLGASDEEDAKEEEKEDEHNSTASSTGKKFALRLESSDSEDDDEHIPLRKAVQKRQIISDDEDD